MNALDFLADFATLVSTSEASRPDYNANNVDHDIDLVRSKVESTSEVGVRPSEKESLVNGERPVDTIRIRSNTGPSLSQHTFSVNVVDRPTSNNNSHRPYEGFFVAPPDPHMSQSFDQFLHQHPGLDLSFATAKDMNYLACDCERLTHWNPSYEMNYSLPEKPASWDHIQPYHQPPNHDTPFLETQFVLPMGEISVQASQCMGAACHCQYTLLHHQVVSKDYAPVFPRHVWGPHTSVYDKNISKEDGEWMWRC